MCGRFDHAKDNICKWYPGNMYSQFSSNSEASTSELLENREQMLVEHEYMIRSKSEDSIMMHHKVHPGEEMIE